MEKSRTPVRTVGRGAAEEPTAREATRQAKRDRAKFARAMTRMAFGRHYWDDRLAEELQESLIASRKRRDA